MEQTEQMSKNDKDACDLLIWMTYIEKDEYVTTITLLKAPFNSKIAPSKEGIGFKYNVLAFRTPAEADAGSITAIIGDPEGYATNLGKLGYHGIMYKHSIKPRKEIRELLAIMLYKLGFSPTQVKKAIKSTVN